MNKKESRKSWNTKISKYSSFLWKKKYRAIIFRIWIIGLILIIFSDYIIRTVVSIENITFGEKINSIFIFSTGIIVLWYTRETFDIKNIQNKQIKEVRKDRYLSKMPMIRMLKASIEPIPEEQIVWAQKQRPDLIFKDEDKSF